MWYSFLDGSPPGGGWTPTILTQTSPSPAIFKRAFFTPCRYEATSTTSCPQPCSFLICVSRISRNWWWQRSSVAAISNRKPDFSGFEVPWFRRRLDATLYAS